MKYTIHLRAMLIIMMIGGLGASSVYAHPPSGIAVDAKGQVYFVDRGRGVWRSDTTGTLTILSDCNFHWLTLDESDQYAQTRSPRFRRVSPDGSKPSVLMASDNPIVIAQGGHLYSAVDYYSPRIIAISLAGAETTLAGGRQGQEDGHGVEARFADIQDLAAGQDGSVYVSEANAIRKVTAAGMVSTLIRDFDIVGGAEDLPSAPRVRGIAVGDSGVVYAAATRSRCLIKVDPTGHIGVLLKSEPPWAPTGVAVAGADVYVLEYDDPEAERSAGLRVRMIDGDGNVTVVAAIEKKEN